MANKSSDPTTNSSSTKAIVTCMDCLHAMLHRYGNNPILAACKKQPQPGNKRFPYVVEVARVPRKCSMHKQDPRVKQIEIRIKAA